MAATQEAALQISVEHLLEGVQIIGFDWKYLYLNSTAARHGGRSVQSLLGRTMTAAYPGIEHTPLFAVLRRVMTTRHAERLRNEFVNDGDRRWFELLIEPVPDGVCVLSVDVTDQHVAQAARKQLEQQLQQAQKMESLGQLAGSIAHDFNNVLAAILGFTELLLVQLEPGGQPAVDATQIKKAGETGQRLTQQLLAFSRQQPLQPTILQVNDLVRESEGLLRQLLGKEITLATRLGASLGNIRADRGQLQQLLVNLAVNARDAMAHGGRLTIETAEETLDGERRWIPGQTVPAGHYVVVTVSDTGSGMPPEIVARIFEPFFTTKGPDKGTGLGLSTVYGIVRQSDGYIDVTSTAGRGTTFRIGFPRLEISAAEGAAHGSH